MVVASTYAKQIVEKSASGDASMFNGLSALSLDTKGRIAIPTRFREKLMSSCAGRVVLTQHPMDNCLALYPEPKWEEIAEKVANLGDADKRSRYTKRRFLGQAVNMELDGSGRILIPGELRELVGLDRKVMLVGLIHRFEIWADSVWETEQTTFQDDEGMPDSIKSLAF
jgi:MraZ protein